MAIEKKLKISLFLIFAVISSFIISFNSEKEQKKVILISAASSLTNVMGNIIDRFNYIHPEFLVKISFGGSGFLSSQIENGAPVDILISADTRDSDRLVVKNIVNRGSIFPFCRNSLVLAGYKNNDKGYLSKDLRNIFTQSSKIGIGNPDYVAAGLYTKTLLQKQKLFSEFSAKFIQGNSVRQIVGWLESRDVDFAFIYRTDVLLSQNIIIHKEYSKIGNAEITYPALITRKGETNQGAELFFSFLNSENSRDILTNFGFVTENLNAPANQS